MSFEAARDAICARAAELAPEAHHDDLVKLADAVQKVQFGPQGATTTTFTDYRYTQKVKQRSHQTTVQRLEGDGRARPGFDR
jgi:hypothetical protein